MTIALLVEVLTHRVRMLFPITPYTRRVYLVSPFSYRHFWDAAPLLWILEKTVIIEKLHKTVMKKFDSVYLS
jgi:hypothetical protein